MEVRIKVIYVFKNKKIMENFEIVKIENLERVVMELHILYYIHYIKKKNTKNI